MKRPQWLFLRRIDPRRAQIGQLMRRGRTARIGIPGRAAGEPSAIHGQDAPSRGTRLLSWKEIAAYLKRDIRTAQRWEKLEGLPVHRHQHDERGTACYTGEIDRWLEARTLRSHTNEAGSPPLEATGAATSHPRTRHYAVLIVGLLMLTLGSAAFARWWDPAADRS